jgi:hypothetical protein
VRWPRRTRLPSDARDALGLRGSERVLAAATLAEGGWLAATGSALVAAGERLEWTEITAARWDREAATLTVQVLGRRGAQGPVHAEPRRWQVADPGFLPESVHERVMASIVVSRQVPVRAGAGLRIVVRRGADGELEWQVVADPGLDPDDPDVRSRSEREVARLRAELGG